MTRTTEKAAKNIAALSILVGVIGVLLVLVLPPPASAIGSYFGVLCLGAAFGLLFASGSLYVVRDNEPIGSWDSDSATVQEVRAREEKPNENDADDGSDESNADVEELISDPEDEIPDPDSGDPEVVADGVSEDGFVWPNEETTEE